MSDSHIERLKYQSEQFKKVLESREPESEYVTFAFYQLHGAKMGLDYGEIDTWAQSEMERLKQITLDNLPAYKAKPSDHDQKKLITYHSNQVKKLATNHSSESEYVTTAFFQLQGAIIGFNTKELFPWALKETERLHQIALDKL